MRNMLTAFDGVSGGRGEGETEEDASLGAEKGTIRGGSRKDGWEGDTEK